MATQPTDRVREKLIGPGLTDNRKHRSPGVRVALVYPNTYHVGMSNLGFQTVYRLLNRLENTVCERAFLPSRTKHGASPTGMRTVESGSPLSEFDTLALSLSYENDYIHLPAILEAAGIPAWSRDRHASHPLVIAGGVACMLNPEPVADFVDCFLIGEAEGLLPQFFSVISEHADRTERNALLKILAQRVPGAYVPGFYRPEYNSDGTIRSLVPDADLPPKIRRVYAKDLSDTQTYSAILTPDTVFADTFLIETARGCPRGCRFCAAGYVYRPPRFQSVSSLHACIREHAGSAEKIGLVGAAVSDLPGIADFCSEILGEKNLRENAVPAKPRISFSSLRADSVTPELAAVLRESGTKTATIAPEAGSQRMRDVINKGLDEAVILNAAECLVSNGIPNLRLYFMVGLPTETPDDVDAIVRLCDTVKQTFLRSSRTVKRIGQITVSLNAFVPKPWTPFQWAAMDDPAVLKKKIKRVKQGLKPIPNVEFQSESPRHAQIQALLSRGDRSMSELLYRAYENGGNWPKTLKEAGIRATDLVCRERGLDEIFPWDMIDHGISKAFLKTEYARARKEKPTRPCMADPTSCDVCGVCGNARKNQDI